MSMPYDSVHESEDTEQDSPIDFNPEGPQPYNYEPAAREVVEGANYDRLNGMREEIEIWARDNVDRIGDTSW